MKVDNYYPYDWSKIFGFWESDYKLTEKTLFTNKYIAKKKFINGELKKIQIWVK